MNGGARNGTELLHLHVPISPNAGCAHSIVNFRQTRHFTLRSSRRVQGDESTTGVPYCCAQQAGRNSTARVERAQRSRHTCKELRLWAERLVAIVVLLSGGALHIRAIRAGDLNSPQLACGRRCTRRVRGEIVGLVQGRSSWHGGEDTGVALLHEVEHNS